MSRSATKPIISRSKSKSEPFVRDWAHAVAKRTGPRKAKVALARKLAVMLHAMWRTGEPFEERIAA